MISTHDIQIIDRTSRTSQAVVSAIDAAPCVLIFGSYAAKCAGAMSDIDVLCVGTGPRVKTRRLDLLWIAPEWAHRPEWLGSELASHIAKHGRCLRGNAFWMNKTYVSERAIIRKVRAVERRARAFDAFERMLSEVRAVAYATRIRRETQRLSFLLAREAVPATPILDEMWQRREGSDLFRTLSAVQVCFSSRLMDTLYAPSASGPADHSAQRPFALRHHDVVDYTSLCRALVADMPR